ncbi:MAG TPA: hypothetical protein VF964_06385, partial [Vicinamibacteria bacterium]
MSEPIPPYHDRLADLVKELSEAACLGVLVLDLGPLAVIEDQYGIDAYEEVRQRVFKILEEHKGKDYRTGDILSLDRPRGLRFIFFLERKRRRNVPFSVADLRTARGRLLGSLLHNLSRAAFPYLKATPRLDVGCAVVVHNPLLQPERLVERAIAEALAQAA